MNIGPFKIVIPALGALLILAAAPCAKAQEPELVSEVVAQVNNDIITRADYLEALKDFKEELQHQMAGKSQAEIQVQFEKLKPTVLDLMIDDLLLEQKAKDMGADVEAEVNEQMLEIAKSENLHNLNELEEQLRKQGVDPESARAVLRKRFLHQYVLQREVFQPLYQNISDADRQAFFDKHKEGFTMPGEVTLSEIFLPLDNQTASEVEQRARRLVVELRAGASFGDAANKNSPESRPSRAQNGKMGSYKLEDLKVEVKNAIANLKPGDVTDPIRLQDGYQIIRLDERKPPTLADFHDKNVQDIISRAIIEERQGDAQKRYLSELREQAYIDIKKGYSSAEAQERKDKEGPKQSGTND